MKGIPPWLVLSALTILSRSAAERTVHPIAPVIQAGLKPALTPHVLTRTAGTEKRSILTMVGVASWYSSNDPGVQPLTASGEPFDDHQFTCAVWNLPFNAKLHVTNLETGQAVVVRVNDRGPARRLVAQGRVLDLSQAAFSRIASLDQGLVPVKVELLAD